MNRSLLFIALTTSFLACTGPRPSSVADWQSYGRDAGGNRYSPARQINRNNVSRLKVAWTYHTGELQTGDRSFEATPIVVDGWMYLSTPLGLIISLDPVTGTERWKYDAKVDGSVRFGDFTSRGVSSWLDIDAVPGNTCRRRIVAATIDARLLALDAATGKLCASFGVNGVVDLRTGLRNTPFEKAEYEVTSPPAIVGGLIVVGSAVADNNRVAAASGEVRAYDVRTGQLKWTWDPVPQNPRDAQYAAWRGDSAHRTGAANAWSVIAVDSARGLLFVPTSSPSPDYFGGQRLGRNDYANSIVALRVSTGEVVWHFQTVHHDLWDYDNASPPALVDVTVDGKRVPAVLQATKTGMLFVLHRETGTPLVPVEERAVPKSDVPGEEAWPTQPFSQLAPLSPHRLNLNSATTLSPANRAACEALIAPMRNEGIFTPPSLRGTVAMPSNIGGAHWGGVAWDAEHEVAILPVNHIAAFVQLLPTGTTALDSLRQYASRMQYQVNRLRGLPFYQIRGLLRAPDGTPCSPPPYGSLIAVDVRNRRVLWQRPLGFAPMFGSTADSLGSPNLGGPVATAGDVVFIGATLDKRVRAFDSRTGRELWSADVPAGAKSTPMTYVGSDGRQYVVWAAGGDGGSFGRSDAVVAFALPR